jgi:hypothetical protein
MKLFLKLFARNVGHRFRFSRILRNQRNTRRPIHVNIRFRVEMRPEPPPLFTFRSILAGAMVGLGTGFIGSHTNFFDWVQTSVSQFILILFRQIAPKVDPEDEKKSPRNINIRWEPCQQVLDVISYFDNNESKAKPKANPEKDKKHEKKPENEKKKDS